MNNKTIAIFIILGLTFGIILSTVIHFTTETTEHVEQDLSTRIADYNCSIEGKYYHYSECLENDRGKKE